MALRQYEVNQLENDAPQRSVIRALTLDTTGGVPLKVVLRFFWSTISEATGVGNGGWMIDISDQDGNPLVLGLGFVLSTDIFNGYRHLAGIPDGQLFAFDTSLEGLEPGLEDFISGRVQLLYRPADEVT